MQAKRATIKMRVGRCFMVGDYIIFADNKKARTHHPDFSVFGWRGLGLDDRPAIRAIPDSFEYVAKK